VVNVAGEALQARHAADGAPAHFPVHLAVHRLAAIAEGAVKLLFQLGRGLQRKQKGAAEYYWTSFVG
jgi:hypothetical protein